MEKLLEIYKKYKEKILYLFFGGCTTIANIIVYALAAKVFKLDITIANIIAWFVSVLFAYITNKLFVFSTKTNNYKDLGKELISFFLARILTLLMDTIILKIGVQVLQLSDLLVKIFSNILVIIANYFLSKIFIFTKKD